MKTIIQNGRKYTVHSRKCPQCGVAYETITKRQQFCSYACAGMARRTKRIFVCGFCGKTMLAGISSGNKIPPKQKFCSLKCAHQNTARVSLAKRQAMGAKCEGCDSLIVRYPSLYKKTRGGKYWCSVKCRNEHHRTKLVCEFCSQPFTREYHRLDPGERRFCSNQCRVEWLSSKTQERERIWTHRFLKTLLSMTEGDTCAYPGCTNKREPVSMMNLFNLCKDHAEKSYYSIRANKRRFDERMKKEGLA